MPRTGKSNSGCHTTKGKGGGGGTEAGGREGGREGGTEAEAGGRARERGTEAASREDAASEAAEGTEAATDDKWGGGGGQCKKFSEEVAVIVARYHAPNAHDSTRVTSKDHPLLISVALHREGLFATLNSHQVCVCVSVSCARAKP